MEDRAEILRDKFQLPDATVSGDNLVFYHHKEYLNFTPISKEHMNITMQHYIIIKLNGVGGGEGRYGMFNADMYYHSLNSLLCVAPWVSLPKDPYLLHLTRNDRSDCANAQADLSLH